jgi:predicted DNA-binding transcriptional regulator AlpA
MIGTLPEVLNEKQVSEIYGFSVPFLRRARRERRGPRFLKISKSVRYRRSDVEAYLDAHQIDTQESPRGHNFSAKPHEAGHER